MSTPQIHSLRAYMAARRRLIAAGGGGSYTPLALSGAFDEASTTGGISIPGSGERLLIMAALNNSTTIPTVPGGWTQVGSGISGNGRAMTFAWQKSSSPSVGSWSASRLALWTFDTPAAVGAHDYTTDANGTSISFNGLSLQPGAWVLQASMWGFSGVTPALAVHTALGTVRTSNSGPPGRVYADANDELASFGGQTRTVNTNHGGAVTGVISIYPDG